MQSGDKINIQCMSCGQVTKAPAPLQQIVNLPDVSMLVVMHSDRFVCGNCGTESTLLVREAQTGLVAAPAPPKPNGLVLAHS